MKGKIIFLLLWTGPMAFFLPLLAQHLPKQYQLYYDKPVPVLPVTNFDSLNEKALVKATPFDPAWESLSLPIGNGYLGAAIFGRTDTERVQLTENSMAARSLYGGVGLTAFAELYIDFNHTSPTGYSRSLCLDDALSTVKYDADGIIYKREYFASYPDKVLVIKLTASQHGKLSFTLRPQIPYKKPFGAASHNNGRTGKVFARNDLITLSGKLEYLNILFEGQFKVVPFGGTLQEANDADGDEGKLMVSNADSALILVAVGTNYKLESSVFLENNSYKKITDTSSPHNHVSSIMEAAAKKTYGQLLAAHKKDYSNLFSRVNLNLGSAPSPLTTSQLMSRYKAGAIDHYLEELYFQYGRYLLICSSRPGTLPPNLQGVWNQYDVSPWTGGYWHNINIQMNYWPVFNTNLAELFQSFADYNMAYRAAAQKIATQYIAKNNTAMLAPAGGANGWTIGTGASAYNISGPGNHSGPGTGGLTTKMFWDYYAFTGDVALLKKVSYPAIIGMSDFLLRVVTDTAGLLLASPSYSPEQSQGGAYYKTTGCAFDQQMIAESHNDALKAAAIISDKSAVLPLLQTQLPRLDPVQIGWSGQVKEYREENYYGEIGEVKHRHISHLVGLYPGTIINANTPAWLDAAKETLERRGDKSTGWAMAHRLNLWARAKEGDRAYILLQTLLQTGTFDNLWNRNPPFTIEGNLGATAGMAEMLLQSHEGYIHLLPALPQSWQTGSFSGLMARGNFEVSAEWNNGQAKSFTITSNIGGPCRLRYFNLHQATVKNRLGKIIAVEKKQDFISFKTTAGEVYSLTAIPLYKKVANPSHLLISDSNGESITIKWDKSPAAAGYNFYTHVGNAPDYTLVRANIKGTSFQFKTATADKHFIIKLTAVDSHGRESSGVRIVVADNAVTDR